MSTVGLVLHGQLRLTLCGPSQQDVQTVIRATGACEDSNTDPPDVEIHFTANATADLVWKQMGERDALAAGKRFAIAPADTASPVEVKLPGDQDRAPYRLTYPTGIRRRLPLLRSMINRKCVDKQMLGIHATAFTLSGRGYLACGWPRGGKTGVMLAYLLQGAEYLAAEWVYVGSNGRTMHGVPEPLRLRDWHLQQGAKRLENVAFGDRLRMLGSRAAAKTTAGIAGLTGRFWPRLGRSLRKLAAALDRHRYIDRPAAAWLGKELRPRSAPLDTLLFVGTHTGTDIRVTPLTAAVAKRRLVALQDEDLNDLTTVYRRWSYAMSDPADCRDQFERKRDALFDRLLEDKAIYAVDHPHNVNLTDLFQTLESSLKKTCLQSL